MLDKFKSMQELEKETIENEDWKIITRNRNSSVSILAIHGGGIEPATTELASIIADEGGYNYFIFEGLRSKGNIEKNVAPLELALSSGATFVAQGFSSDIKALTKLIEDAINHDGFSFVNVFSPCVTYNKVNTYDWFKEHLTSIEDIENYDPTDKQLAMKTVLEHESLVKGIVYQDTTTPSYESQIEELDESALTKRDIRLSEQEFNDLTAQFV